MAWNPNIPTVTNRVQDDLNAIRENFQHLDPLAQAVGELQAVSGLAPYVQAIRDSRIVEMGSNANGAYVRWENGLQVCYVGPVNTTFANASNLLYVWTYPATFASSPRVYATGYYQAFSEKFRRTAHIVYSRQVRTSAADIGFGSLGAWENGDQSLGDQIMGYAIGRWK